MWLGGSLSDTIQWDIVWVMVNVRGTPGKYHTNIGMQVDVARLGTSKPNKTTDHIPHSPFWKTVLTLSESSNEVQELFSVREKIGETLYQLQIKSYLRCL